jgi:hypothetical protein
MTDPSGARSASDRFEAALQASCDALIELQLIRAQLAGGTDVEAHATRAISALQRAIAEFRSAYRLEPGALDVGFVLARRGRGGRRRGQSRPRRTA